MFKDFEDRTEIYFLVGNFYFKLKSSFMYITLYFLKECIHSNTLEQKKSITSSYHVTQKNLKNDGGVLPALKSYLISF